MTRAIGLAVLLAVAIGVIASGCRDGSGQAERDRAYWEEEARITSALATSGAGEVWLPPADMVSGDANVFAASSLQEAFEDVRQEFEQRYPQARVRFNFGASSALATQIKEGAPADIFASADTAQMQVVVDAGLATRTEVFATNELVLVVPAGTTRVSSLEDLARPGLRLVLAGPDVPAGRYAREILHRASSSEGLGPDFAQKVQANVRSEEPNVRSVLAKVQLGEADAGIVYKTDIAAAAGEVDSIPIPAPYTVRAEYPLALIGGAIEERAPTAFVLFLLSPFGDEILQRHGFGVP